MNYNSKDIYRIIREERKRYFERRWESRQKARRKEFKQKHIVEIAAVANQYEV